MSELFLWRLLQHDECSYCYGGYTSARWANSASLKITWLAWMPKIGPITGAFQVLRTTMGMGCHMFRNNRVTKVICEWKDAITVVLYLQERNLVCNYPIMNSIAYRVLA